MAHSIGHRNNAIIPWCKYQIFIDYLSSYKQLLLPPFSRHRCSLRRCPLFSRSMIARLTVLRDELSTYVNALAKAGFVKEKMNVQSDDEINVLIIIANRLSGNIKN
jgi:hypothetical protein